MKNKKTALSLTEVLVATGIIAVAVYGMIMAITGQQMADSRLRDRRVVSHLHRQLVREVLKNERNQWTVNSTSRVALDTGGAAVAFQNPSLGQGTVANLTGSLNGNILTSTLTVVRNDTNPPTTLATSTIVLSLPYSGANAGNWDLVRP